MNRLHQLKQTLKQNLDDNADYDELEFVVLDYNSQDGMEEWVKENFAAYIYSGRMTYYKTTEPVSWSPSHSKNLAFKLASGDILCSIWADYFTGEGFAHYVNSCFIKSSNIVLTPIDYYQTKNNYHPPGDVLGKVCVKKINFEQIRGFDERMNRHGFEDYDFVNRLEMVGVERVLIETDSFLKFLSHDDEERYSLSTDNLKDVYLGYKTPFESDILLLYKDFTFEKGVVIDNYTLESENYRFAYKARDARFEFSLRDSNWQTGCWNYMNNGSVNLSFSDGSYLVFSTNLISNCYFQAQDNFQFYCIQNLEIIQSILRFKHFIYTRSIMEHNLKNNVSIVNGIAYGNALVYKNFNTECFKIN